MRAQRGQVGLGAVAFVLLEAVDRVLFVQLQHQAVAGDFGDN